MAAGAVFDTFGLLEHILSYCETLDLLSISPVSKRWKEASRLDQHWKLACVRLWRGKLHGLKPTDDENDTILDGNVDDDLSLFWRPLYNTKVLMDQISVRQMRSLFRHPLLEPDRLKNCVEKSEMKQIFHRYCKSVHYQNPDAPLYNDIWFGAYASSVIDSKRDRILKEELCSKCGFDMFFKILEEEIWDENDLDDLRPYDGHAGILLYHHSICYFEDNHDFCMEMKEPETYHPTNLQWRWQANLVQVGPYPYLTITRLPNWGWKLENVHVVLLLRDEKSRVSRQSSSSSPSSSSTETSSSTRSTSSAPL